MSGFENNVLVADNVNFNPNLPNPHLGTITTDGQLIIGSTALNPGGTHLNIGQIVAGSGITVGYSSPNITISASSSGQTIQTAVVTLTSLQIKSLNATPIVVVPAPGPGLMIYPLSIMVKFNYGGNNPFVGSTSIILKYGNTGSVYKVFNIAQSNTDFQATSSSYTWFPLNQINGGNGPTPANIENIALYALNPGAEITGNASNDNTISIRFSYYIAAVLP